MKKMLHKHRCIYSTLEAQTLPLHINGVDFITSHNSFKFLFISEETCISSININEVHSNDIESPLCFIIILFFALNRKN